ncbi:MAG: ATP-binding cassette domain-containing protein [Firmicutes bacterium]|nr:ATP-binding cassette domain-containing protein [Bacillota bacterium]
MEYVLQTTALQKKYGRTTVLNNMNMHIPRGALYGFVGKNGAGKTTLIRLICGLQFPTAGEYSLFGISNTSGEIAKSRMRMGSVVEAPALYTDMTAEDNLKEQYRILGLPSFESIPGLLALVGLQDTGKKKVKHFSLGMRQRLGIAVALAGNPDLLVLDEPANGLDPQGIVEMRELLLRLNRERGITVLISSHILDELSRLATHYGFIDRGSLLKEITAEELEAACRKCLCVTVSDIQALCLALDEKEIEYHVLSDNQAEIFGAVGITDLVEMLSAKGCVISDLHERDEGLESYYMNLIGGKHHE